MVFPRAEAAPTQCRSAGLYELYLADLGFLAILISFLSVGTSKTGAKSNALSPWRVAHVFDCVRYVCAAAGVLGFAFTFSVTVLVIPNGRFRLLVGTFKYRT